MQILRKIYLVGKTTALPNKKREYFVTNIELSNEIDIMIGNTQL